MAVATAETIKAQILTGTYPSGTIEAGNVFDYVQYEKRRTYPSCEIITVQPESTVQTKKTTEITVGFEIRYYVKNLGLRSQSILTQKDVEDEILTKIEAMTLQDHKVVLESKIWQREQVGQFGKNFPPFIVSTLKITVRQITPSTAKADDFVGNLICNIPIKAADLGTTGEKLNKLITLRTTGEHPDVTFIYTNKTGGESPSTITETFTVKPDTLQRLYRYQDTVVYRLTATVTNPSTITVT